LAGTGIRRNPEESGGIQSKYMNSCPTGIPAKNSCDSSKKQQFLRPPPKPRSCEKILQKTRKKRNPQESCFFLFLSPKNRFLSNRNRQPRQWQWQRGSGGGSSGGSMVAAAAEARQEAWWQRSSSCSGGTHTRRPPLPLHPPSAGIRQCPQMKLVQHLMSTYGKPTPNAMCQNKLMFIATYNLKDPPKLLF
jgi:hypothetical protein